MKKRELFILYFRKIEVNFSMGVENYQRVKFDQNPRLESTPKPQKISDNIKNRKLHFLSFRKNEIAYIRFCL